MGSSAGGGGPGSAAVPLPNAGATNIFPDQQQAQAGALSGAQGIANNTFYPMPQVTSFLFPQGIPGSIAPEGGYNVPPTYASPPPPPPGGMGFDTGAGFSTMAPGATPGSAGPATGIGAGYYGAPDTAAQLAEQVFGSVQAGGQYSPNPDPSTTMSPTDMMQLQSVASGAAQNPYISQQMAQQFLQGNYGVANQLASSEGQWMPAVEQQAAQGSLAGPTTAPSSAWGSQGGGGGGGGGGQMISPGGYVPPPAQIGSEMNPALAGFLGGAPGAAMDLMGGGMWGNPFSGGSQNIGGIFGGPGGQAMSTGGPFGGNDPMATTNAALLGGNAGGLAGQTAPGGGVPGMAGPGGGAPGQTFSPLPANSTAGFSSTSPGFGPTQPGQTGSPIGLNQNSQGTQTIPGANFFQNPITGAEVGSGQIGSAGFGGLNTSQPTAANFVSPGTQGTGQGQMGGGLNFSYPGAAAFLGLGPQIAASAMDVPPILQGAGGALLNTGFDPQGALYARTQNQNAQQAAANMGAAGLGNTPYGTSVENLNNENFNIDWQNAQLARQSQALQGAGSAFQTAQGLQQSGLTGLQAGALGATAQSQQAIQDYLQYAGAATAQNQLPIQLYQAMANAANQAQSNKQQASQAGTNTGLGLLGSLGSGLGSIAGK
jgi:hypothetical protein